MARGDRARWCQRLAAAMVDADLSIDAAGRLWGLKRQTVVQLLRSDTVRVPDHVQRWLERTSVRRVLEWDDDPEERAALQDPKTH